MPLISSSYQAPWPLRLSGHLETIYPNLMRPEPQVAYQRERLETPDGDFIDLDWCPAQDRGRERAPKTALVIHGLEGSSQGHYVKGMVRALGQAGWDACAYNMRGCSGHDNRLARSYHSGDTHDLDLVVRHVLARTGASPLALVGFSLGGNLALKYLGEARERPAAVRAAVAFSVPCDLAASSARLATWSNRFYLERFLRTMRDKVRRKARSHPQLDLRGLWRIHDFRAFDDRYTAPLNGFANAADYWRRSSCLGVLEGIEVPSLVVQACNDPFLSPSCYPKSAAERNANLVLEMPQNGGHVGFACFQRRGWYWSERRAVEFLGEVLG